MAVFPATGGVDSCSLLCPDVLPPLPFLPTPLSAFLFLLNVVAAAAISDTSLPDIHDYLARRRFEAVFLPLRMYTKVTSRTSQVKLFLDWSGRRRCEKMCI